MQGQVLEACGRLEDALARFEEGIATLTPDFLLVPTAFRGVMAQLVREYVGAARALAREPDDRLLEAVLRGMGATGLRGPGPLATEQQHPDHPGPGQRD
jgi:hypothetical protein